MRKNYRTIMRTVVFTSVLVVGLAGYAMAQTPDGQTPAEETVCDRLEGVLFGLCNAYCEALDCDEHIRAGTEIPPTCGRVLKNFEKRSGGVPPPCFPETCTSTFPQCDGRCPAKAPFCFNQGTKVGCRCLAEIPRCGDFGDPLCNGDCPPGSNCVAAEIGCRCLAPCETLPVYACNEGSCPEDQTCEFDVRSNRCGCSEPGEPDPCPCGSTGDLLEFIGNRGACLSEGDFFLQVRVDGTNEFIHASLVGSSCNFGELNGGKLPTTDEEASICIDNILATGLPDCR